MFFKKHPLAKLTPFTLSVVGKPSELSREAATQRHEELMAVLPERLRYIEHVLAQEGIVDRGDARAYLTAIGEWVASHARTEDVRRFLPAKERGTEPTIDVDIPTVSACHYVGYLFAARLMASCGGLRYELCVQPPRRRHTYVNYHESVVYSRSRHTDLEPVTIAMNFTRRAVDEPSQRARLAELYDIWLGALCD